MPLKTVSLIDRGALERIHKESLRILENVGVQCDDAGAVEVLRKAGAKVVGQTQVVRLPPAMVEETMAQITKRFEMVHPSGERFWVPGERFRVGTRVRMPNILDYGATQVRRPRRQDVINLSRITNALKGCEFTCPIEFPCSDVPPEIDLVDTYGLVYGITGHMAMAAPATVDDARIVIDTSTVAVGSTNIDRDPGMWVAVNSTSPLRLGAKEGAILRYTVSRHMPIDVEPMSIAGATTPFTLAGTLLVENAETLFLCVLANTIWPGAKIIHSACANIMNMKRASISQGSAEAHLLASGELALAQFYGMPTFRMGCYSDAYYPDVQAGIEKTACDMIQVMSGADLIVNGGPLSDAAHLSYEQLVIDHDIWEYCQRLNREIEVSDETLAYDTIARIGPAGSYLADEHTMKWLRTGEHYYGGSFNHTGRPGEENTMLSRAHQRVEKILAAPFKWGAPPDAVARLKQYVCDFSKDKNVPAPDWAK
jgi:trimethylamine---corrinoid protein Co-methyltransferase